MTRHDMPSHAGRAIAGLATVLAVGTWLYTGSRRRVSRAAQDSAPGFTTRRGSREFGKYAVSGRCVTIGKPRTELFAFWRDFANLARFMENVEAVRPAGDDGHCVWTIRAPAGRTVDVETVIAREEPGELIAWRSVEGSDIDTEGRVTFEDAPGDRGTRVSVRIAYKPPAGELGRLFAKMQGREPEIQARRDLRRFKMLMETGEIATSARRKDQTRAARQARKHDTSPKQQENA